MKLHRLRIFQAGGLGICIMYPLAYLAGILFSTIRLSMDPRLALILLVLPAIILGEIAIGYWIGRHVDRQLFFHVFLANIIIVVVNFLISLLAHGVLQSSAASALMLSVVFAWPTAILVRKRYAKRR